LTVGVERVEAVMFAVFIAQFSGGLRRAHLLMVRSKGVDDALSVLNL
jgi:hypothetical protein